MLISFISVVWKGWSSRKNKYYFLKEKKIPFNDEIELKQVDKVNVTHDIFKKQFNW